MKVLITDDNDDDRRYLRQNLEHHGIKSVIEARDGQEGFEMATIHKPDMIISDALMPNTDGFIFLRNIRQDETLKFIPFIFYSAVYTGSKEVELATSLGADAFIVKPKDSEEFFEELIRILTERILKIGQTHPPELVKGEDEFLRRYSHIVAEKLYDKARELTYEIAKQKLLEEERRKLEEQLRLSQKMEAMGQLAGGIAHDFNNLLHVIMGYTEIVTDQLIPESRLHKNMLEIMKATKRAADLVRQILLFSRRDAMNMKATDLNEVINNLIKMIQRVIGENISLKFSPGYDISMIKADRGQIEQVLMNLCVNAKDAMPDGGLIVIETGNISLDSEFCKRHPWSEPGDYVLLTISDTGTGISHELHDRIFEPFFTTKEIGKGTGLGLAVAYGIIRSHCGLIHVYSEPGHGAVFRIYLPVTESHLFTDYDEKKSAKPVVGGKETLLFAEDEEPVRTMMVHILEKAGYSVFAAKDGEEAIRLFEEHSDEINLALLDVMMPKVGGQKVLEKIRTVKPDMPVIFLTGYSKGILNPDLFPDSRYEIIQKPCNTSELLHKIREISDAAPPRKLDGSSPHFLSEKGAGG